MIDKPWWMIVLSYALWAVVMSLIMGWLARSRLRTRPAGHLRRLVHPPGTLIIGLVCLFFFVGLAIASNIFSNETTTWQTTAIFVAFALLSIPLIVDFFFARYELAEDGMAYRKLIVSRQYLSWSELRSVKYSPTMKWFRLETRSGEVARISVMLMGLPEFARLLLEHAPPEAIEPEALPIIQATAGGNPPSIWV